MGSGADAASGLVGADPLAFLPAGAQSRAMLSLPPPRPEVLARREAIIAGLHRLVPGEGVIGDALRLKPYETDGLAIYRQPPLVVVLPETTEQVAAVLRFCQANGVRVVPRGAGT